MDEFIKKHCFQLIFFVLLVLYIFPVWIVQYLPMHDFPQHMAQVSVLKNYSDPLFGFQGKYRFDWFTPYLSGVILTWIFSLGVGLLNGARIVISLTIILFPLSLYALLKKLKGDTWWSLLGFPMAYGFNFAQGHYNFWVAIPFGILFVAYSLGLSQRYFQKSLLPLPVFSIFLFFSHVIVFVACVLFLLGVIIGQRLHSRTIKVFLSLVVLGCALPWLWWLKYGYKFQLPVEWKLDMVSRLVELPSYFLGPMNDAVSSIFFILLVVLMLMGSEITKTGGSFLPLIVSLGFYFVAPYRCYAHSIYQRLSVFLIPGLFSILKPLPNDFRRRISRLFFSMLIIIWGIIVGIRNIKFNREAQGFNRILAGMEMNKKVLPILFKLNSNVVPSIPYAHFVSWYQAYKGGEVGFSFSMQPPQIARLKDEYWPMDFNYIRFLRRQPSELNLVKIKNYDYFVVRSEKDEKDFLFKQDPNMVSLIENSGMWWLYKNNYSMRAY